MKQSERNAIAKVQALEPAPQPVIAGDHLAGDQFARADWAARIAGGDSTLSRLALAHKAFHDGYKSLREAHESKDPTMSPEANFMQMRALADKWLTASATSSDRARELAETEVKLVRAEMERELGIVESHRAAEIRSMLRGMKPQERQAILQEAVAERDAETIAAVTTGPTYLSGMTREQATALRRQYETAHGGDRLARIDAIEKAIEVNRATALEAMEFSERLLPSHRAAEIAAKQRAAREIRERMAGAL